MTRPHRSWSLAALALLLLSWPLQAQDPDVRRLRDELLNGPGASLRLEAAQALGRVGTRQSVRTLQSALPAERSRPVRLEIVRALRAIAFQRYAGYRQALAAIGYAADDDNEPDELVRLRATEALWEAGNRDLLDPVPILHRQMGDRSQRLRLAAVFMLRKNGSPEAAVVLERIAVDKAQSEKVRLEAIEALGAVALSEGGPVGRIVAGGELTRADHLGVRPLTSDRALERRHERQIHFLATVARDPDSSPTLVLRAVKSMGQVKDKSAVPVLQELMANHPHTGIRKHATRVLSHILARQYE